MVKKVKKVILGTLIAGLCFTGMGIKNDGYKLTSYAATSDWSTHWAKDDIQQFIEKGYIGGYSDGTFKPNNSITRAEFVKIFNKAFELTEKSGKVFNDTKTHWAKDEIDIAVSNGVCNGKSVTEFKPNDSITREEAAVMIANYKKISDENYDKIFQYGDTNHFNNTNQLASWAEASVEGVLKKGYMKGYSDWTFRPKGKITRAEAVVTINRVVTPITPRIPVLSIPESFRAMSLMYYDNELNLDWWEVEEANGYEVYRATSSTGPFELIATTIGTSYIDKNLPIGETFYYKVRAYATMGETNIYGDFTSIENATVILLPRTVDLNKRAETLTIGETLDLVAKVVPINAPNKELIWTSSNSEVATVDSSGKVTAVGEGNARITVTTVERSLTATCDITVRSINHDFKSEFEKLGFVFQTDTTALYDNGIKVGLVKRDGFWQLKTQVREQELSQAQESFLYNCVSVIWGNDIAWNSSTYIDYAVSIPNTSHNTPYITTFVQDGILTIYVYESTKY